MSPELQPMAVQDYWHVSLSLSRDQYTTLRFHPIPPFIFPLSPFEGTVSVISSDPLISMCTV